MEKILLEEKKLIWDGQNTRITNFDLANQFVGRDRRKGWDLSKFF